MKFLSDIDTNGNKLKNVGAGLLPTDGVALSQVTGGRLAGVFQLTATENQSVHTIPVAYQSKGLYLVFSDSVLIPPPYLTFTTTTITVNTTNFYLTAGTLTVIVFS